MEKYTLDISSGINGGYFSSEQIDLLSIIRCTTPDELVNFVNNCFQIGSVYSKKDISAIIDEEGLEKAKRQVFKDYQNSMVLHDSSITTFMVKTFKNLSIKDEDIETIIITISKLSQAEKVSWAKKFIKEKYPGRSDEIFYTIQNFRSIERNQTKSNDQYEEISILNDNLDIFNTMILGSGRIYNVLNPFYEESESDKRYCFDRMKTDLDFAYKNGKQVRYHSLLVQEVMEKFFDGYSKEEIKEILKNYVKESIDFINEYNATHKLNVDGKEVGAINSVVLFNEIVSFWKNKNGEYFNVWEENYGITTQDLADIFKYARDHKPEGVSFIYNEPYLEANERRKAVFKVLGEIDKYSPGLIDTLGSQMHVTIDQNLDDFESSFADYKSCFADFKKLQDSTGKKIEITEFDMQMSRGYISKVFGSKPTKTLKQVYEEKERKISEISNIIKNSNVKISGVSYWSLADGIDFNLERIRSNALKNNQISNIDQIPTVCGGLIPTHKRLIKKQELDKSQNNSKQDEISKMLSHSSEQSQKTSTMKQSQGKVLTKTKPSSNSGNNGSAKSSGGSSNRGFVGVLSLSTLVGIAIGMIIGIMIIITVMKR